MSPHRDQFITYKPLTGHKIRAANKQLFNAKGTGDVLIEVPCGDKTNKVILKDTLHAPGIHSTLVSLARFDTGQCVTMIKEGNMIIKDRTGKEICHIPRRENNLYQLFHEDIVGDKDDAELAEANSGTEVSMEELHRKLGHSSQGYIKKLLAKQKLGDIKVTGLDIPLECKACLQGKATTVPIAKERSTVRAVKFGEQIHMDIWGPAPVVGIGKYRYTLTMLDDATLWLEAPLMKTKDEALAQYKSYQSRVKTESGVTFGKLHSDRGTEFTSTAFTKFLEEQGTKRSLTVHDTPQHNGSAERTHRTLLNTIRTCLVDSGMPKWLWPEAHRYAVYIFNITPHASINFQTPWELRFGKKPDYERIHPFGAQVMLRLEQASKLNPRAKQMRYLGPDPESSGHRIYDAGHKKVLIERNVVFLKQEEPAREQTPVEFDMPQEIAPEDLGPRVRNPTKKSQGLEYDDSIAIASAQGDPVNYKQAMADKDKEKWLDAMQEEIGKLEGRNSWSYAKLPPGANTVGSRFVYARKRDPQGNVTKFRARLVAQGFSQKEGIDYYWDDTFSPVARMESARLLCALAAKYDWELHQMDVKSAFLYGKLDPGEEIYLRPPQGVELKGIKPGEVLKLNVCLYGLKQAARRWYKTYMTILYRLGFQRSLVDEGVFYRNRKSDLSVIFIHIDDSGIITQSTALMTELKNQIKSHLDCDDMGEMSWMLGIEIKRDRPKRLIRMSQETYIKNILERHDYKDIKPVVTPVDPSVQLTLTDPATEEDKRFMKDKLYRAAIGALMYLVVRTRPDVAFATITLARYSTDPRPVHWRAIRRIFAYLQGTKSYWLTLGGNNERIQGYCDADGMSDLSRRPISGYVFTLGGAVSWSTKKQDLVTLSTTEAEFISLCHAGKEALWLRSFLSEFLPKELPTTEPMELHCDNQGAIALTKDNRFHQRTKHMDIKYKWIAQQVELGKLDVIYCPTEAMRADIFTKGLKSEIHKRQLQLLNLQLPYTARQATRSSALIASIAHTASIPIHLCNLTMEHSTLNPLAIPFNPQPTYHIPSPQRLTELRNSTHTIVTTDGSTTENIADPIHASSPEIPDSSDKSLTIPSASFVSLPYRPTTPDLLDPLDDDPPILFQNSSTQERHRKKKRKSKHRKVVSPYRQQSLINQTSEDLGEDLMEDEQGRKLPTYKMTLEKSLYEIQSLIPLIPSHSYGFRYAAIQWEQEIEAHIRDLRHERRRKRRLGPFESTQKLMDETISTLR